MNTTGSPIDGAIPRISSDVNVFKTYEAMIPSLPSDELVNISNPQMYVNGPELSALTESLNANITIGMLVDNKILSSIILVLM